MYRDRREGRESSCFIIIIYHILWLNVREIKSNIYEFIQKIGGTVRRTCLAWAVGRSEAKDLGHLAKY